MFYCNRCGKELGVNEAYCTTCGEPNPNYGVMNEVNNANSSNTSSSEEKLICVAAYLGILVLIPLIMKDKSPKYKFHANQGMILFAANFITSMVGGFVLPFVMFGGALASAATESAGPMMIISILACIFTFVTVIGVFVLFVMGIVNAVTDKEKPLPIIGKIKILK